MPRKRVSWKKYQIENQSLRYLPYVMGNSYPIDMIRFDSKVCFNQNQVKNLTEAYS